MDLIGMEVKRLQAEAKFTVLTRKDGTWTREEVNLLVTNLNTEVHEHPRVSESIIISGEHSSKKIQQAIGKDCGQQKILTGYDNPELPFRPPSH